MPRAFPEGFVWGTATAAHQIEGGNVNNDWWAWEHDPDSPTTEPSGDACDSWLRWGEDVDVIEEVGFGAYRFSIEWSRIEPAPGEWSHAAMANYRRLCEALLDRGIEPAITFHHFTTPRWVAAEGGWAEPQTAERFAAFCRRAAGELGDVMRRACTLNEPNIVSVAGYLAGMFPPGVSDVETRRRANRIFVDAHRGAVDAIREAAPDVPVGLTLSMADYEAAPGGEEKMQRIRYRMQDEFLEATEGDDFIGVQTYTRSRIGPDGALPVPEGAPMVDTMGYEYYPPALANTLRYAWDFTGGRTPLLVTENGLSSVDDERRIAYLREALDGVLDCLEEGIDVRGYTYWSLLDNFEWNYGYEPRFGLVEVDRETFERKPKPSARWLSEVIRANALPSP